MSETLEAVLADADSLLAETAQSIAQSIFRTAEHKGRCDQMLVVCRYLRQHGFSAAADCLLTDLEKLVEQRESAT